MIITAKFGSRCPTCGGDIQPGDQVEWERGKKAKHAECPRKPLVGLAAPQKKGANRRPGACESCGMHLKAGEGTLVFCVEDSGCLKHHDDSGYHLYCSSKTDCEARVKENKAARQIEIEEEKKKVAEKRAVEDAIKAKLDHARSSFTERGWVRMSGRPKDVKLNLGDVIGTLRGTHTVSIQMATLCDGTECAVEEANGYDDWRSYFWGPKDFVHSALRAYASENGITKEKAKEWLERYSGCEGEELYKVVVDDPTS